MEILDINTYKEYQGISSDKNDTKIIKTINSVNAFIPSYCNRSFVDYYTTPKVEYFDATEKEYYPLEFPIINVASIKYSSALDGVYDSTLSEYTDYVIDYTNSRIVAVGSQFINSAVPINSGELTYTAGYSEYPLDILQAAVLLTEYYMEEAYTPRKSLAGASSDSVIQPDLTARLPQHIRRILEHHRAWNW
jgi:hypothetical protein